MGGNVVPVVPAPKGQFLVFFNGLMLPQVTKVKLPASEHGVTETHPGGRATPIFVPSGNTKWEDLEITEVRNSILPSALRIWYETICNPETGVGIPAEAASQIITVVETNGASIPLTTWTILALPYKRDPGDREGGSDDPTEYTMTFKVNMCREV